MQKNVQIDSYIGLIGTDRNCKMKTPSWDVVRSQGQTFWILSFIFNCWLANVWDVTFVDYFFEIFQIRILACEVAKCFLVERNILSDIYNSIFLDDLLNQHD